MGLMTPRISALDDIRAAFGDELNAHSTAVAGTRELSDTY